MKKFISALAVILVLFSFAAFAEDKITVILDGQELIFDSAPEITNDRTMVPMRLIFEKLGASVNWVEDMESIEVFMGGDVIVLFAGRQNAIVNGDIYVLDSPPYIKNERTLVPLRFISETAGAKVDWDDATKTVNIISAPLKSQFIPFGEYLSIPSPAGFTDAAVSVYEKKDGRSFYAYNVNSAGYDNLLRYEKYLAGFGFALTVDKETGAKFFYNGTIVLKTYAKTENGIEFYYIELYSDPAGATLPK